MFENRCVGIKEKAKDLNTSTFWIKRVNARLVTKDLNIFQNRRRVAFAKEMLENVVGDPSFIA